MLRKILPYLLYALVVAGLIVAIIFAIPSSHSSKKTATATHSTHSTSTQTAGTATQQSNPSYNSNVNRPTPSAQPSGASTQALSNSGPGDVVALFVVTVAGGAVAFSWYQRRNIVA